MRGPLAKNFFEYSIGRIIKLNAWSVLMFAAQIRNSKSENPIPNSYKQPTCGADANKSTKNFVEISAYVGDSREVFLFLLLLQKRRWKKELGGINFKRSNLLEFIYLLKCTSTLHFISCKTTV